jgi:hypothetical protein
MSIIKESNKLTAKDINGGLFRLKKSPSVVRAILIGFSPKGDKIPTVVVADDDQFNSQGTYIEIGQFTYVDPWETVERLDWNENPSFKVIL